MAASEPPAEMPLALSEAEGSETRHPLLTAGEKLGAHQIVALLGPLPSSGRAGGTGEVYQAHDTKLGRDVGIKVLPEAFAHDPRRLSRFQREAKLRASLNHLHIATLHALEESN